MAYADDPPGAYVITHPGTGLMYIGSSGRLNARKNEHLSKLNNSKHAKTELQEAFSVDKTVEFTFYPTLTREIAYNLEQTLLSKNVDNEKVVNRSFNARSSLGVIPNEDTREKMSKARTGAMHSEETKKQISQSNSNKVFSDEHRKNLSDAQVLRAQDETVRAELKAKGMVTAKPVTIEGNNYESLHCAAKALGISKASLTYRVNSGSEQFKEWKHK